MQTVKIGLIGGSGLGAALAGENGVRQNIATPFGPTSSPVIRTDWSEIEICIIQRHGLGHTLNPSQVPYRANIFALKALGCTHILASGATGSLRQEIRPRDLVIVDQIIDKTCKRDNTFYEKAAVHVEFADPICPVMRSWLLSAASRLQKIRTHEKGTYVCMEGPAFSTRAESHMHRMWGGDLIGMTAMPEARLAREAELPYTLIALPTDYDCWKAHDASTSPEDLLEEIIGNMTAATQHAIELIKTALQQIDILKTRLCPAHSALSKAIWSDKAAIPKDEIDKLKLLWGRYFNTQHS